MGEGKYLIHIRNARRRRSSGTGCDHIVKSVEELVASISSLNGSFLFVEARDGTDSPSISKRYPFLVENCLHVTSLLLWKQHTVFVGMIVCLQKFMSIYLFPLARSEQAPSELQQHQVSVS